VISQRKATDAKAPAEAAASSAGQIDPGPLSRKELAEFRSLLLAKRQSLVDDLGMIWSEESGGESELLAREYDLFRQIDSALARMDKGVYGVCEATGTPISRARLRACPWARYCIEYARRNERGKTPMIVRQHGDEDSHEQPAPDTEEPPDLDRARLASG